MTQAMDSHRHPFFLITNDDGYHAPGIRALRDSMSIISKNFLVVAPAEAVSGCGHSVTTHKPIRSHEEKQGGFSIEGTPADCVRMAISRLLPDFQWVVSGINAGGNLGVDIFHSGTVAAVREAVFHQKKGIAISHYIAKGHQINWLQASQWAEVVIRKLLSRDLPANAFWNVNLPCLPDNSPMPEIVDCDWDRSPLPLDYLYDANSAAYNGVYYSRKRVEGSDVSVCFGGKISVSLVQL